MTSVDLETQHLPCSGKERVAMPCYPCRGQVPSKGPSWCLYRRFIAGPTLNN
jgi:hypothetical protein